MEYRLLSPDDAMAYQPFRSNTLQESPTAFASSYEEHCKLSLRDIAARLKADEMGAVVGAFNEEDLVGASGVKRESQMKLAHKAYIWGVYVDPQHRRRGIGRELVRRSLDYAFSDLGVRQVNLGVNVANTAAIAVYEAMGFKRFGLEEGFLRVDGVLHDELHMVCRRPSE